MIARLLTAGLLLLATAKGQPLEVFEAVAAVRAASKSVVFVGSYLRTRTLAEALHAKATSRSASVLLITSPHTYLDPNSYFLGLYLAGARLYLGRVQEYLLVVDGQEVYAGRGLGGVGEVRRLEGAEAVAALETMTRRYRESSPLAVPPETIVRHFWRQR